jgi:hypothetical protein
VASPLATWVATRDPLDVIDMASDMFDVPLSRPYDLAVASQVFHHFEPGRCVELMRRISRA